MTSSNGNISRVTGLLCGEFPSQRQVAQIFDIYFDLHLNKRLSEQSGRWWNETPSRSLWRHCNDIQSIECLTTFQMLKNKIATEKLIFVNQGHSCELESRPRKGRPVYFPRHIFSLFRLSKVTVERFDVRSESYCGGEDGHGKAVGTNRKYKVNPVRGDLIRENRGYVYGIWEYKLLSIKMLFHSKIVSWENNKENLDNV